MLILNVMKSRKSRLDDVGVEPTLINIREHGSFTNYLFAVFLSIATLLIFEH